MAQTIKNLPAIWETQVQPRGQEYPLEKGMATHPGILAWRIPWTEEPGGLQSMGSQSRTGLTNTCFRLLSWLLRTRALPRVCTALKWPGNSPCAFSGVWDWASGVQGGDLGRCVGSRWMSHALHTTHFIFFYALNNCNKIHKHISTFVKSTRLSGIKYTHNIVQAPHHPSL